MLWLVHRLIVKLHTAFWSIILTVWISFFVGCRQGGREGRNMSTPHSPSSPDPLMSIPTILMALLAVVVTYLVGHITRSRSRSRTAPLLSSGFPIKRNGVMRRTHVEICKQNVGTFCCCCISFVSGSNYSARIHQRVILLPPSAAPLLPLLWRGWDLEWRFYCWVSMGCHLTELSSEGAPFI